MDIEDLQITDPQVFTTQRPYEIWDRWRAEDPVHWTTGHYPDGFWSLTRHADISAVYRDPLLFSTQRSGPYLPTGAEFDARRNSKVIQLKRSGAMLVHCDPPRHSHLRKAFQAPFVISAIKQRENSIRAIVKEILDIFIDQGGGDFVADVSAKLPISVIFGAMDIPRTDWPELFHLANMATMPDDPEFSIGTPLETKEYGSKQLLSYCIKMGKERRSNPGQDLISVFATAEVEGGLLTEEEVGLNVFMLVIAGQETTRNALSGGMLALIEHPEEFSRLKHDRSLLNTAPDEFVRWVTPLTHIMRTATRDTVIGDKQIRENDWVVLWNASANRDSAILADPYRFDVGRKRNAHLGFGQGEHFCLGAHLAKLELKVMLEALLDRTDGLSIDGTVERSGSLSFAGIKRMPVSVLLPNQHAV